MKLLWYDSWGWLLCLVGTVENVDVIEGPVAVSSHPPNTTTCCSPTVLAVCPCLRIGTLPHGSWPPTLAHIQWLVLVLILLLPASLPSHAYTGTLLALL